MKKIPYGIGNFEKLKEFNTYYVGMIGGVMVEVSSNKEKAKSYASKEEAFSFMASIKIDGARKVLADIDEDSDKAGGLRVSEAVAMFLSRYEDKGVRAASTRQIRYVLTKLESSLGKRPLASVNHIELDRWLHHAADDALGQHSHGEKRAGACLCVCRGLRCSKALGHVHA
jgi:hypothetical protein